MPLPAPIAAFLRDNNETILATLLLLIVLLLIAYLWMMSRLGSVNRLYKRLLRGSTGSLEEILHEYMATVSGASQRTEELDEAVTRLGENQQRCLQKVGIVRFDAFDDVGGEQSFALVLLDSQRTGIAVSSVYSRSDVRVYAKAIRNGQPSHPLTREEERALAQAEGRG